MIKPTFYVGLVSPLGTNVDSSWNMLVQGKSGVIRLKDEEPYTSDVNFPDCCIAPVHRDFDKKAWQVAVHLHYNYVF